MHNTKHIKSILFITMFCWSHAMFSMDITKEPLTTRLSSIDISPEEFTTLAAIVNEAYLEGERGICIESMQRTSAQALSQMVERCELIGLLIDGALIGCIHVRTSTYEKNSGLFGMLVVANEEKYRGKGFGTLLVEAAEEWARNQGFSSMNLELLKPTSFTHAHKNRLEDWYIKRGYVYQYSTKFMHPELLMITENEYDFKIYRKFL